MRQAVDVLAVFDVGAISPRPIRFKVVEHGIKKTVRITEMAIPMGVMMANHVAL